MELPPELWRCITSFLDERSVWKLHSLNRVLRDLALESRLETYSLDLSKLARVRYLERHLLLGHPDINYRVRNLSIGSSRYSPYPDVLSSRDKGLRKLSNVLKAKLKGEPTIFDKEEQLQRAITSLTGIQSVHVHSFNQYDTRDVASRMPLLLSAMQSYSTTLARLSLAVAPFTLLSSLLTTFPVFPQLKTLLIKFFDIHDNRQGFIPLLQDAVLPFLKNHRSLSSVEVYAEPESNLDISYLYDHMPHMVDLASLTIHFNGDTLTSGRSLARLIGRHSETLTKLSLFLVSPHSESQEGIKSLAATDVPLPCLERISLESYTFHYSTSSPTSMDYVSNYCDQLKSLVVLRRMLLADDWRRLSVNTWPALVHLDLGLRWVSPEILDIITLKFPQLRTLVLAVSVFCETLEHLDENNEGFVHEMLKRKYENSSLVQMSLLDESRRSTMLHHSFKTCVQAVIEAFPLCSVNEHPVVRDPPLFRPRVKVAHCSW